MSDYLYQPEYGAPQSDWWRYGYTPDNALDDSGAGGVDPAAYLFNDERSYDSGPSFDLSGLLRGALGFASTPKGLLSILAALASAKDRRRSTKPTGGGVSYGMTAPRQLVEVKNPGKYSDLVRYAANGGLMHAYAQGGPVRMEDGGFVLTKRAVDGAGGPGGLAAVLPHARMIRGPGTGTSDSIPATITGPKGQTPARVSNGEAYVPRRAVQQAGGPKKMYGLMSALERRA